MKGYRGQERPPMTGIIESRFLHCQVQTPQPGVPLLKHRTHKMIPRTTFSVPLMVVLNYYHSRHMEGKLNHIPWRL